jgi:hypothetical protein
MRPALRCVQPYMREPSTFFHQIIEDEMNFETMSQVN